MARRRRQSSVLDDALNQPWPFSAVLAVLALLFGHVLIPSLFAKNIFLVAMVGPITLFANLAALLFGLIAAFKFAAAKLKTLPPGNTGLFNVVSPGAARAEPTPSPRSNKWGRKEPNASQTWGRAEHSGAVVETRSGPLSPLDEALGCRSGSTGETPSQVQKPTDWSLDVLQRVEWKLFEDLCAAFYREKGILCDTTALGPDGGIDIRLYQDEANPTLTTAIVQCKAMRIVGIKPMRELLGVMAHEKLEKGFFMTSGEFTDDTKAFGQQNRIVPVDGKLLLVMIKRLPAESQKRLLDLATAGDWTTPTCPDCGKKMVRREVAGKPPFWGCASYPKCRGRLGMRKEQRMG